MFWHIFWCLGDEPMIHIHAQYMCELQQTQHEVRKVEATLSHVGPGGQPNGGKGSKMKQNKVDEEQL